MNDVADPEVLYRALDGGGAQAAEQRAALEALTEVATVVDLGEGASELLRTECDDGRGTAAFITGSRSSMLVLGFDAAQQVLRDGTTYSSDVYGALLGPILGRTIIEMDEPDHRVHRQLVQHAFSCRGLTAWIDDEIDQALGRTLSALVGPRADLVPSLTFPFPFDVVARMLGLPREDVPVFRRAAVELLTGAVDFARGRAAADRLAHYLGGIVAARRTAPRDDLVSMLVAADIDGRQLDDAEVVAFVRLLLMAGAETTYRLTGILLLGLLGDPEQLDAVRRDRALLPHAIEEALRWEPPLQIAPRRAIVDAELDGVTVPRGALVFVHLGMANRDRTRWHEPGRFDLHRPLAHHLAFASGPHMCLGMHLARRLTGAAVDRLLDHVPSLRLDPDVERPSVVGTGFRAPSALPVLLS